MQMMILPFASRLLPADKNSGLQMPDYWIWCSSAIRATNPGEDGRFHLFASRWPRALSMAGHWPTNSEVIHAISDTAEGPYQFESVALPSRGPAFFEGMATHNPCIRHFDGKYYLYYVGTTFDFERPTPANPIRYVENTTESALWRKAWESKRTGLAVSDSVNGPWKRLDQPLLQPRPDKWDAMIISNPGIAIRDDGYTLLIYKSRRNWNAPFELGLAHAPHPAGPFERLSDEPTFPLHCEDPCLWWEEGRFHVIMKDFSGEYCGVGYGGVYASSENGHDWKIGAPPLAYTRTIQWSDGTSSIHGNVERAGILVDGGRSTHLLFAITAGEERYPFTPQTRSIVIPLKTG